MENRKPELLSPAGSYKSMCAAVQAGADAVYASGKRFGARAYAENLDEKELADAIDYVHLHGRKLYLTINTLFKDQEMDELYSYLLPYYEQGLDAVIVQDVGVFSFLRRQFPDLPLHISTQMTIAGPDGAAFFVEQGASRIILARELSLKEIRSIRRETEDLKTVPPVELECFIHGALCYCYSGQCLLSSMIGGRSGNRGQCAQPCRLFYSKDGQKTGSHLSMKDLCTLTHLMDLINAGIDSFKIEGRMKQPDYVYTVTSIYRKYLDLGMEQRTGDQREEAFRVDPKDLEILQDAYQRRGYTDGYLYQHNGRDMISFERPKAKKIQEEDQDRSDVKYAKNATILQEKINGKFMLSAGSRATLYLESGDVSVTCQGDVAEPAKTHPLTPEMIEKQIRKTGGTLFVFEHLKVEITGSVFLSVQSLNQLRRDGLLALQEKMLSGFKRMPVQAVHTAKRMDLSPSTVSETPGLAVLVSTNEQLRTAAASEDISRIYVDAEIGFSGETLKQIKECHCGVYLAMPYIFREDTRDKFGSLYESLVTCYDGVLVRSWDTYAWLRSKNDPGSFSIVSDQNLYVFNRESNRFLAQAGIKEWTAPAELNARELEELQIAGQTLAVYGYQPVMVSANCIRYDRQWTTLTDESHHSFYEKNVCSWCYNLIYNGVPLMLLDQAEQIRKMHPGFVRLDFTRETGKETDQLIADYADRFLRGADTKVNAEENKPAMPSGGFTRGHFKRGVK